MLYGAVRDIRRRMIPWTPHNIIAKQHNHVARCRTTLNATVPRGAVRSGTAQYGAALYGATWYHDGPCSVASCRTVSRGTVSRHTLCDVVSRCTASCGVYNSTIVHKKGIAISGAALCGARP